MLHCCMRAAFVHHLHGHCCGGLLLVDVILCVLHTSLLQAHPHILGYVMEPLVASNGPAAEPEPAAALAHA
jgi:hypothetical protein